MRWHANQAAEASVYRAIEVARAEVVQRGVELAMVLEANGWSAAPVPRGTRSWKIAETSHRAIDLATAIATPMESVSYSVRTVDLERFAWRSVVLMFARRVPGVVDYLAARGLDPLVTADPLPRNLDLGHLRARLAVMGRDSKRMPISVARRVERAHRLVRVSWGVQMEVGVDVPTRQLFFVDERAVFRPLLLGEAVRRAVGEEGWREMVWTFKMRARRAVDLGA